MIEPNTKISMRNSNSSGISILVFHSNNVGESANINAPMLMNRAHHCSKKIEMMIATTINRIRTDERNICIFSIKSSFLFAIMK